MAAAGAVPPEQIGEGSDEGYTPCDYAVQFVGIYSTPHPVARRPSLPRSTHPVAAGQGEAATEVSQGGDAERPVRRAATRRGRAGRRLLALLRAPMVAVECCGGGCGLAGCGPSRSSRPVVTARNPGLSCVGRAGARSRKRARRRRGRGGARGRGGVRGPGPRGRGGGARFVVVAQQKSN